jgi:hypothetical protein
MLNRISHAAQLLAALGAGSSVPVAWPLGAQTVEIDTIPGELRLREDVDVRGRAGDYFSATYGFDASPEWFDRVRLSVLRVPGCSASFVSPNGLVATNHHCVRGRLTAVQRPGETLLDDGFYAGSLEDERRIPGYYADRSSPRGRERRDAREAVDRARPRRGPARRPGGGHRGGPGPARAGARRRVHVEVRALYHGGRYSAYVFRRFTGRAAGGSRGAGAGVLRRRPGQLHLPALRPGLRVPAGLRRRRPPFRPRAAPDLEPGRRLGGQRRVRGGEPGPHEPAADHEPAGAARRGHAGTVRRWRPAGGHARVLRRGPGGRRGHGPAQHHVQPVQLPEVVRRRLDALRTPEIMDAEAAVGGGVPGFHTTATRSCAALRRAFTRWPRPGGEAGAGRPYGAFRLLRQHRRALPPSMRRGSWPRQLLEEARRPATRGRRLPRRRAHRRGRPAGRAGAGAPGGPLPGASSATWARTTSEVTWRWAGWAPAEAADRAAPGARSPPGGDPSALDGRDLERDPAVRLALGDLPQLRVLHRMGRLSALEEELAAELGRARFDVYGTSGSRPTPRRRPRITDGVVLPYEYNGTIAPVYTTFYGMYDHYHSYTLTPTGTCPAAGSRRPPARPGHAPELHLHRRHLRRQLRVARPSPPTLEMVGINFDRNIDGLARLHLPPRAGAATSWWTCAA